MTGAPPPAVPKPRAVGVRFPHLACSLMLVPLLLVPFLLAHVADLEPYPAILFPSGHGTIRLSSPVLRFGQRTILGRDAVTGEWIEMDMARLLRPIPARYHASVFERLASILPAEAGEGAGAADAKGGPAPEAGVSTLRRMVRGVKRAASRLKDRASAAHAPTAADRAELSAWLGGRLAEAGCATDEIMLRRDLVAYDIRDLAITGKETEIVKRCRLD